MASKKRSIVNQCKEAHESEWQTVVKKLHIQIEMR